MQSPEVLALWTVPRSASTAFERMVMERSDRTVLHEPFSLHYYYGPDKQSTRFAEVREHATSDRVFADIAECARRGPVFVKDMAYHLRGVDRHVWDQVVEQWTHTFLIRDPARSLPSFARHWADPTIEEAGFDALAQLVDAAGAAGPPPVIVDSADLMADPEGTVRAYCAGVGIEFLPDALSWEAGMRPEWGVWEAWHDEVSRSSGFEAHDEGPIPELDDALRDLYVRCRPVYERLHNLRITPLPAP